MTTRSKCGTLSTSDSGSDLLGFDGSKGVFANDEIEDTEHEDYLSALNTPAKFLCPDTNNMEGNQMFSAILEQMRTMNERIEKLQRDVDKQQSSENNSVSTDTPRPESDTFPPLQSEPIPNAPITDSHHGAELGAYSLHPVVSEPSLNHNAPVSHTQRNALSYREVGPITHQSVQEHRRTNELPPHDSHSQAPIPHSSGSHQPGLQDHRRAYEFSRPQPSHSPSGLPQSGIQDYHRGIKLPPPDSSMGIHHSAAVYDNRRAYEHLYHGARPDDVRVGHVPTVAAHEYRRTHDLPEFSGRPEDWPMFSTSFWSTTEAYRYNDLENLLRLQKCLSGDAKRTVESLLIHPRHVGDVMLALEDAFGRPEVLIRSQIKLARQLAPIDEARLDQMLPFSISVRNLATFLDSEATQHHLANPTLLDELVGKLPISRRIDWAGVASRIRPYPTILDFSRWVSEVARLFSLVVPTFSQHRVPNSNASNSRTTGNQISKPKSVLLNVGDSSVQCSFCAESHDLRSCDDFLRLRSEDRLDEVTRMKLCQSCLQPGHMLPFCCEKRRCDVNNCISWHSPMLHVYVSNRQNNKKTTNSQTGTSRNNNQRSVNSSGPTVPDRGVVNFVEEEQYEKHLLFRIVPVTLHGQDRQLDTFAILDEGSSISLIDADVANHLKLEGPTSDLSIQWFGSQTTVERSGQVSLKVQGISESTSHEIHNVRTIRGLKLPTQSVNSKALKSAYPYLKNVPFAGYERAQPTILIGLDHHHLGVPMQTRTSRGQRGIAAAKTKIGWVVYGSGEHQMNPGAMVLHVHGKGNERYEELSELVRSHFTTEDFGVKLPSSTIESDDAARARGLLETTTRRTSDRFQTGLLWKHDNINLPDSYNTAVRRLLGVEAKMTKDPQFAAQYNEIIHSYVQKGYARKLSPQEAMVRDSRTWYLPHFAVRNPNKPGKLRLVFDAAAETKGVSLNSVLLSGPDLNIPMTRILFRFRIGLVGVCADIREMYHQVQIQPSDQNSQRFLWRNGVSSTPPEIYTMQVMTFGATCSPSSAQFVKNLNAAEFTNLYPAAATAIQDSHYVDDFVASFATPAEASKISAEVVELHRRGGFELRGFVSSHKDVIVALNGECDNQKPVCLEPKDTTEKILGMSWDTSTDCFRFETRFHRVNQNIIAGLKRPSKREILSVSMSIFDPFGLLANFTLVAKLILQDLWRIGADWDEPVSESIDARWQEWRSQIQHTKLLQVPRCYSPNLRDSEQVQLHVFADASECAFAAVAYWRVQRADGFDVSFIAGKARCAPLQILSIPRLELQAAVLATRLMSEIRESHGLHIDRTFMWSDSQTVLQWIGSDQRKFKPFVAFRVAEIVESAPATWWNWVPTSLNVADDATRVKNPILFDPESRWIQGPPWLREYEVSWPQQLTQNDKEENSEEMRVKFVGFATCSFEIDFLRFSKYLRLCRTVAWVRRFAAIAISRKRGECQPAGELTSGEVNDAVTALCRIVQRQAYQDEIAALLKGSEPGRHSALGTLKVYIDEDGLIRVHGRTDAADDDHLPLEAKRPILLPRHHRFTMLLVEYHHCNMAHQLVDATISAVRQKFWVPQLRVLVRSVQAACVACKIRTAMPTNQVLGQLPIDRLTPYARPFTNTGMDYFGPVAVTIGRRREKRWVALFTCLAVRAVHLEIAADLSTDACLMCVRNFCNIRGVPSRIRCDNGTNFVGAKNVLAEEGFFNPEAIQQELSARGIEWIFNCPANPEAGGAWERLVQSVKRVLKVTLKDEAPRVETLRAHLLEAANILNSRPLTHLPVEPDDPEPITPNHFLIGGANAAISSTSENPDPAFTKMQWKICKDLSRRFWRQWIRDYLPELTRRSKNYPNQPSVQVGDLVVICDGVRPRSHWSKGRIVNTFVGPDGIVRTAEIQTTDALLRRPVSKLAILDVSLPIDIRGRECRQLSDHE